MRDFKRAVAVFGHRVARTVAEVDDIRLLTSDIDCGCFECDAKGGGARRGGGGEGIAGRGATTAATTPSDCSAREGADCAGLRDAVRFLVAFDCRLRGSAKEARYFLFWID